MANRKLGIDVEIKYPTANQIKDSINKEWQKVKGDFDIKVNIAPDGNSMRGLRKTIQDFLSNDTFDFKLKIDTIQAMKDMREIRQDFKQFKKEAEDAIEVKFTGIKEQSKDLKGVTENIQSTSKTQQKSDTDKMTRLRQINQLQKEMNTMQKNSVGASSGEQAIYNKRIEEMAVQLKLAKSEYKDLFNSSADDEWMVDNVKRIGEMNVELKESKEHQKETNSLVKEYTSLLNSEFKIHKDMLGAGEEQRKVYQDQLQVIRSRQEEIQKTHGIEERMSESQRQSLVTLEQQNKYQSELNLAKEKDESLARAQNEAYKEIKRDMSEIHKIHMQIADLQAKSDAGVATAREEDRLSSLKQQLVVREDMHNTSKDIANAEGLISKEAEGSLDILHKQQNEKEKIATETAKINAELKISNGLYDDLMSSVKRVKGLTDDLAKAGSREADVIRDTIRAEENKQDEIRETLKAQERVNTAREEEYSTMKRINSEQEELSAERSKAGQADRYSENSIIGMFDPRTVFNEGKQAAMHVYGIVEELDKALVDIEKVADASDAQMAEYQSNLYGFATDVGVTADVYATSTERWLTQGFALDKAIELATQSTMGAFVGNIDEAAIVDYLSVPLLAFEDSGIRVDDILNSMNEVANNNAIEMDDLGKAYQRSANTAGVTGTSFAELTGMITGAQEATRLGGEAIGTSLRAIDMNFSKMGSGLTKADIERTNFFKNIGVDVLDANGELNSSFDIIEQLQGVWGDLNSNEQSTASFYAGGKLHAQTLQGVIKQWDKVEKAIGETNGELELVDSTAGSAYKEFEAMQGSVEFAVAGLKNAWTEFIYEISGGRDGVTMVVEALTGLVNVGNKLAKNDVFMSLAKTLLNTTLWLTGGIAIQKLFTAFSGGLGGLLGTVNKGIGLFKGLGGVATAGTLTVGKLVPVIGLVIGAMTLLDLAGIDVVDSIKKVFDGTHGLSDAMKDYQKTYKETTDTINNNKILNKEFDEIEDLIKKYQELNKEKEKDFEKRNTDGKLGNDAPASYSDDEFELFKAEFEEQASALDIDLQIEFNNYEYIKGQLAELEKRKNELEKASVQELATNIMKRNDLPSNADKYDHEDKHGAGLKDLEAKRNAAEVGGYTEEVKRLNKEIDEYSRVSKTFTDPMFDSAEFKAAKEAREQAIKDVAEQREKLVAVHKDINPADLSPEQSLNMGVELMPALAEMHTQYNAISDAAERLAKNEELSVEQRRILVGLNPDLSEILVNKDFKNWSDADKKNIAAAIKGQQELAVETNKSVEDRIRALLVYSGEFVGREAEMETALESMKGSHQDIIGVMSQLGDAGEIVMGVTEEALAMYGTDWPEVMAAMQTAIEGLDSEKVFEYNLVTDDGFFNWEVIELLAELPEEVVTDYHLFDEDGTPKLDNIIELLDGIPQTIKSEYNLEENGVLSIDAVTQLLKDLNEEDVEIDFFADKSELDTEVDAIMAANKEVEESNPTVKIYGDRNPFATDMELVRDDLTTLSGEEAKPTISANSQTFEEIVAGVVQELDELDADEGKPKINADPQGFDAVSNRVDEELATEKSQTVTFKAVFKGLATVRKTIANIVAGNGSVGIGSSGSTSITSSGIGGALGQGISQSVGLSAATTSTAKGNPRYAEDRPPAKVDTDVWRYWAKEMFKGLPLENSMDTLNNSVKNASEDNKKLISLYKEQNKLINQQVAYQKDIKNAQQSEMNHILSQLKKEGFKTSGNQITNLDISKNMSGDKAERSGTLLSQWKSLYEAMDTTNDTIKKLNQEVMDNNKSVKDTQEAIKKAEEEEKERLRKEAIEKELKEIEKSIKRAEGLLTNIENDMSLFSTKIGLVGDSDYELKLTVTEEGINKASQNVSKLTDEFNKLSKISVEYEENVDGIQSELEALKGEILENADAILDYRDALKELEIQRMSEDFDRFATTMEANIGRITNNIDNLKDGLVSGQSLSELSSASLMGIDFSRKTGIEREHQQRLELERELNEALDGFAKKNIDRATNVANATLSVEKNKYSQLLKLANGYSNGKVESVSISSPTSSIGATTANTSKNKEYQGWLNRLTSISNDYVKAYNAMVSKYDNAMSKASTTADREILTNSMIIEQLKLQEKIYESMMTANNSAIKNTQDMLKDSSLTTEQRQQLLDNIEEYRQTNISSQNSIKDSIKSRFDLEFELVDEATDKASKYTTELSNMMAIAEALGSSDSVVSELYRALYESKINEYTKATGIISELAKQQGKFEEGSFEWNILQEKILETQESLNGLTVDILNTNKDILDSQLNIIQEASEKLALGSSAEEYDRYRGAWMDGVEKELELEKLRMKLAGLDDKNLQGKISLMDRQEKVSRAELEYIDKQLEATRLQEKLDNIRGERNVQTLGKDSGGNWQWQYVADQGEYDSTKEELNDVRLEIEKYREEQKRNYVSEMNDIVGRVRDGDFNDVGELETAIKNVNEMFDDILGDTSDSSVYDTASIIQAYQDYLSNNNDVMLGVNDDKKFSDRMVEMGATFEQSFMNVTTDLSKLIADELVRALNATPVSKNGGITIENQVLEFPNVKDSNGLAEAFRELPQITKQMASKK